MATHIFQWYDLLYTYAPTDEEKHNLLKDGLTWTEEAVRRSPYQAPYRDLHAKILWRMGTSGEGPQQLPFFEEAIEEFKTAADLYPTRPEVWQRYGDAAIKLAKQVKQAGNETLASELYDRGHAAKKREAEIRAQLAGEG
ncbi:MAG: hypothetical protein GY851_29380 [bacterium]|nr:hypothetical protein [bacterium]